MSTGVHLVDTNPDNLLKAYTEAVFLGGMKNQRDGNFYLPTSVVKCYANKRYITSLSYDITKPLTQLIGVGLGFDTHMEVDMKRMMSFIDGIHWEFKSYYADVEFNTFDLTVVIDLMNPVLNFPLSYQFWVMLMEIVTSINGLNLGTLTFFNNRSVLEPNQTAISENLRAPLFYQSNKLMCADWEHFVSICEFIYNVKDQIEKSNGEYDPSEMLIQIPDAGWRDIITCMVVSLKQQFGKNTKPYTSLVSSGSFESMWCDSRVTMGLQNA